MQSYVLRVTDVWPCVEVEGWGWIMPNTNTIVGDTMFIYVNALYVRNCLIVN